VGLGYQAAVTGQSDDSLTALALVCSLKPSPAPSSSQLMAEHLLRELAGSGVTGEVIRCVDFDIKPGVEADMGDGDQWPELREKVRAADILVVCTPTWMGHMSSVAQRVLERLDAELSETDDAGRPALAGKVAVAAVVGNEDGAHKIVADLFQALNDVGYSIPAQGCTYWNGPAMQKTDYNDLDEVPDAVASATAAAARNAAHLAATLKTTTYPPYDG
jgi:multimeric flavodoxin WrbA